MSSLNVILGAAGAAGFTFGLVRSRLAETRGRGGRGGNHEDMVLGSPEPGSEPGPGAFERTEDR